MKRLIKPMVLVVMAAILITLIILPVKVYPVMIPFYGLATEYHGLPACICPLTVLECSCLIHIPEPQ